MLRFSTLLLLLFFHLISAAAAQDDAMELKLRWEPGMTYVQEADTDTTNFLTAVGKTSDQKLRLHQTTRITVEKNAQEQTEAAVMIESLLGEMSFEGQSHVFDSKNPAAAHPALQQTLGATAGRSFTLVYDANGQFLDARNTASMVTGGVVPDLNSIADARQLATLYRRSLEMGLPKIPVRPGDKWISDEVVPFPQTGTVQVKLNAKFDGIVDREGRRQAQISFEGGMTSKPDKDSAGRELATQRPVTLGDGSKVNGQIFFDLERQTISLAVFAATLQVKVEDRVIPVRQQVTTRLLSMAPTAKS